MLDIKFIREHKDLIKAGAEKKHIDFNVDALIEADDLRKSLQTDVDELRRQQNEVSDRIVHVDGQERERLIGDMRELKSALQTKEEALRAALSTWQSLMVQVPNVPDVSVPDGADDTDNVETRTWGDRTTFEFEPRDHIALMKQHHMVDFDRGVKIAGFRGYVLKNDGVLLSLAIWNLAVQHFRSKGLEPLIVPSLVGREAFVGTGYLPQSEEDLYKTQDDLYLAGTAEVATMMLHSGEVLSAEDLPKRYLAFSPCFRREAGSHGKDTRGLIRVHEFYKWEQVVLCEASHEASVRWHEAINRNTEEFIEMLGIPYRTVTNCGGDLGLGQVKKYDIELWVPMEQTYREISSASYFHDFQARRLNIKYRDDKGALKLVHSLNSTAIPTPRILVSLIENYQEADGSIRIPPALVPHFGKERIAAS